MDDRSGDFVEHSGPIDINLRTLFNFRKPYPPRLDPCAVKKAIPPQPLPVNYSTMAWLWGSGPISGAQLDSIGMFARGLIEGSERCADPQWPDLTDHLCLKHHRPPKPR